jgi:hypothetical protein
MIVRSIVPDHAASLITERRRPPTAPATLGDQAHAHDHGLGAGRIVVITEACLWWCGGAGVITETCPGALSG